MHDIGALKSAGGSGVKSSSEGADPSGQFADAALQAAAAGNLEAAFKIVDAAQVPASRVFSRGLHGFALPSQLTSEQAERSPDEVGPPVLQSARAGHHAVTLLLAAAGANLSDSNAIGSSAARTGALGHALGSRAWLLGGAATQQHDLVTPTHTSPAVAPQACIAVATVMLFFAQLGLALFVCVAHDVPLPLRVCLALSFVVCCGASAVAGYTAAQALREAKRTLGAAPAALKERVQSYAQAAAASTLQSLHPCVAGALHGCLCGPVWDCTGHLCPQQGTELQFHAADFLGVAFRWHVGWRLPFEAVVFIALWLDTPASLPPLLAAGASIATIVVYAWGVWDDDWRAYLLPPPSLVPAQASGTGAAAPALVGGLGGVSVEHCATTRRAPCTLPACSPPASASFTLLLARCALVAGRLLVLGSVAFTSRAWLGVLVLCGTDVLIQLVLTASVSPSQDVDAPSTLPTPWAAGFVHLLLWQLPLGPVAVRTRTTTRWVFLGRCALDILAGLISGMLAFSGLAGSTGQALAFILTATGLGLSLAGYGVLLGAFPHCVPRTITLLHGFSSVELALRRRHRRLPLDAAPADTMDTLRTLAKAASFTHSMSRQGSSSAAQPLATEIAALTGQGGSAHSALLTAGMTSKRIRAGMPLAPSAPPRRTPSRADVQHLVASKPMPLVMEVDDSVSQFREESL